ncbi:hypothetical protein Tco_0457095, partial [Tanacetum coccineum]
LFLMKEVKSFIPSGELLSKIKSLPNFMNSMNIKENSESESEEQEITFKRITFDTEYKIKKYLDKPPTDLELKPHPDHLEYAFLEEPSFLLVIILSLFSKNTSKPLLGKPDIPGIYPSFCKHKI